MDLFDNELARLRSVRRLLRKRKAAADTIFMPPDAGPILGTSPVGSEDTFLAATLLHNHEARLMQGARLAGLALAEVDYTTNLHYLTAEAAALFGLGDSDITVTREQVHRTFHPDDRMEIAQRIAAALDPSGPGGFLIDHRIVLPQGDVRWVRIRKRVFFSAEGAARRPVRAILLAFDVTAEKKAAMAIRAGEEFNRSLMESSSDCIKVLDLHGYVLHMNGPGIRQLEIEDPASLYGIEWWKLWPLDTRGMVRDAVERARLGTSVFFTAMCPTAAGTEKWWNVSVSPMRESTSGEIIRLLVVSRDVTAERQSEQMLRDADAQKNIFIATLAHELRNPLAPIRNVVGILQKKAKNDPQLAWCTDIVDRQIEHMARLLEDLLDLSRISSGKINLRRARHSLQTVVERAMEMSQPLLSACQHAIVVQLPPQPVILDGDLIRLAQIFANLLNNAAKYTPPQGQIALSARLEQEFVVITVRDTGIGITQENLSRIFETFRQVQSSLESARGGIGIGLALVRGLVELHGGQVEARSEGTDKGSEFVVRLPIPRDTASDELSAAPPSPETAAPIPEMPAALQGHGQGRRRVLVADDSHDNADTLAQLLRAMGHDVQVAYDGMQAIEIADGFQPQVALLDLGMPGLSGYDVCRRFRAQPWSTGLLIIAQSGWGQAQDRQRTHEAGFDFHLIKPIDPESLKRLLTEN